MFPTFSTQQQVDTKPLFPAGTSGDAGGSGEIDIPSSDSESEEEVKKDVKQEPGTSGGAEGGAAASEE